MQLLNQCYTYTKQERNGTNYKVSSCSCMHVSEFCSMVSRNKNVAWNCGYSDPSLKASNHLTTSET